MVYSLSFSTIHKERLLLYKIRKIPLDDRAALEAFFRVLILEEGGAYVLFGGKPMAFTAYFDSCGINIRTARSWHNYSENRIIKNGWVVWEKYRSLFPSNHFVLECKPFDKRRSEVCLINIGKFRKTMDENLKDFQSLLGPSVTPEFLLKKYQKGNTALFKLLKEDHASLGILLGFGLKNSRIFQERWVKLGEDPNLAQEIPYKAFLPVAEPYDDSSLDSAFHENNHKKCYKFLRLPYFLVDKYSQETHELQEQYLHQRQEIHERYAHENFLEVTLRSFCDD